MRKILFILLAAALAIGMIGCKGTDEPKEFERGVWTDNVYESKYMGLGFTLPEGFVAATDEEIGAMMDLGADVVESENINELQMKMAKLKTIYDMMAASPASGANVIVMLENLGMTIGGSDIDVEEYADILRTNFSTTMVGDYSYTVQDGYNETLGGEDYYVLSCMIGDGLMTQEYYIRRVDDYMLVLAFSGATGAEQDVEALKASFFDIAA